jgi:hypothetical protein
VHLTPAIHLSPQKKKNERKLKANSLSPKSPELQQILNNTPMLNTSAFDYNNLVSTENSTSTDSIIYNSLSSDNFNDLTSHFITGVISTPINIYTYSTYNPNVINMSSPPTQQTFTADYNGLVMILIECIVFNKNLGNWYPIKAAKFFSTNFTV